MIREELAKLAHEQWSGWMKYLFGKCSKISRGRMVIPKWAVERWSFQMITPYEMLTLKEKDSDRAEADKFLALFKKIRNELDQPTIFDCIDCDRTNPPGEKCPDCKSVSEFVRNAREKINVLVGMCKTPPHPKIVAGYVSTIELLCERYKEALDIIVEQEKKSPLGIGVGPHGGDGTDCPAFYDHCHCTVETLKHNIERADKFEAQLTSKENQIKDQAFAIAMIEENHNKLIAHIASKDKDHSNLIIQETLTFLDNQLKAKDETIENLRAERAEQDKVIRAQTEEIKRLGGN